MKKQADQRKPVSDALSPWWRYGVLIVFVVGFGILIWISATTYKINPPIPDQVIDANGSVVFTGEDIRSGQEVFLKHGLMDNGTLWGHGSYLGPDFSATYLHNLVESATAAMAREGAAGSAPVDERVVQMLAENRYDGQSHDLKYTRFEAESYHAQLAYWKDYFASSVTSRGLLPNAISDQGEIRQVVAFFSWAAWASAAHVPGRSYSYTNNFPYDLKNPPPEAVDLNPGL